MLQLIINYPLLFLLINIALALLLVVALIFVRQKNARAAQLQSQVSLLGDDVANTRLALAKTGNIAEQLSEEKAKLLANDKIKDQLQQQLNAAKVSLAAVSATREQEQKSSAEKLKLLEQAKNDLSKEFENLANRIFDEKSEKFTKLNKSTVDLTVNPLREQIKEFKERVEFVYDKESKDRQSLLSEIGHLKNLNNQISQDAVNLTKALKGESKTQGNWGEVILEKVLEESGLRKGHEYQAQSSFTDDDGRRKSPDVIVHLPDEKDIIIDSKVSLTDYERYCSETDESLRKAHLKAHVASIKTHVKQLSVKGYEQLEGVKTLDFVLLFIPIEAAFLSAFEQDPELFRDAYESNIIVVSPTTLLATLRTIQSIWRYERQSKNAEEIASQAGKLYDQIALLSSSMLDVGKHLDNAHKAHDKAVSQLSSGRGNLLGRAEKLEKLGAKTKKTLPKALVDKDDLIE
ncbi:MAG: DNA recombination protein RmuC [Parvicella sp.]|jgi:DNA recombination protein RmuC